jgi:hypothetical protein
MKINIPRHISISIAFVMIDKHRGVNQEEWLEELLVRVDGEEVFAVSTCSIFILKINYYGIY